MSQATPQDLFDDLSNRIKNIASKMDMILFGVPTLKDEKKALAEDVIVLQCFHFGVFKEPSPIFDRFLDRLASTQEQTKEEKKKRQSLGGYFTPTFIAEYIVRSTLGPLVDKFQKGRKPTKPQTKLRKLLALRICDPAVGGGIFLICAHDYLMNKALEIDPEVDLEKYSRDTAKCLFGVDINPDAVEGCKLALNLNVAKWALKKRIEEFVKTAA